MNKPEVSTVDTETTRLIESARRVWTSRLIDPSRANSLLFFRELKVGALYLEAESEAFAQLLRGKELSLTDLFPTEQGAQVSVFDQDGADEAQKARNSLKALQRKALENLEEKGISTLHLAVGMATWPASDGGRPYQSPVLLYPARIVAKGRGASELNLELTDEPRFNPVLAHVLEDQYTIRCDWAYKLQECSSEDDSGAGVDRDAFYRQVKLLTNAIPGLEIIDRALISNFQFAKMAMVEDLKRSGDQMAESPLVAAIAGHSESRRELSQADTDDSSVPLDERPPKDEFLVLDADSTQMRAIAAAGKGRSCVIQGPPGTGKSQTIANFIAQSIAEGKRVLFVAEKRAALEAVIKRLSHPDVGLGHLILDLHGASVSRKAVSAQLADTLSRIAQTPKPEGADQLHLEFEARRKLLNEHAQRVNRSRAPTDLSINQLIGRLLRLPPIAQSPLRLRGASLESLTPSRASEVRQWVLDAAANPSLFLGTDPSPWNNAALTDGAVAKQAIDLSRRCATELWPRLEKCLSETVSKLGIRRLTSMQDVIALVGVLQGLSELRANFNQALFTSNPGELARALEPATHGAVAVALAFLRNPGFRSARRRLLSLRREPAPARTLHLEASAANALLRRWKGFGGSPGTVPKESKHAELDDALRELSHAVTELARISGLDRLDGQDIQELSQQLSNLASDQRTPFRLPGVLAVRASTRDAGLTPMFDELRNTPIAPEYWIARFDYILHHSSLDEAFAAEPSLAAFNGRTHEQVVQQFIHLDRERIQLASQRVRRVHAELATEARNRYFTQADVLRSEANKKARHLPIRELFAQTPDILTRVAPCCVASPLSVSQLLGRTKELFDIVIFDEASQILQEEAIPSLWRAKQVVVAGDRHQLPPTTFFAAAQEEEATQEPAGESGAKAPSPIGGFESILGTLESFLPNVLLEWHYRSEDERLITFSNANVYDGRLITFPCAHGEQAIHHILVPHDPGLGAQEESGSREVEEVVRQVLAHAENRPDESLGVITMGIKHANRVQAALDRALEMRPDLAEFFSLEKEERFFVKNLENVQGDERTAIVLSVGYAKSPNGDLPHRFGPLTQEVGYRRLNVAVTRAKRRMCVISSFSHHEIDLGRAGGRGVALLKAYLDYAASGGLRLPEREVAGEVDLNPFESDVRNALASRGIEVRGQFGASRYRIDLVALHPRQPGRPVLAIECDGATYHSGATARDRDRLRQTHLQRLGWRFHRIWSTDWFYNREDEISRAVGAYEEAVRRADLGGPQPDPPAGVSTRPKAPVQPTAPSRRGPQPQLPARGSIEEYRDSELRAAAEWINSDGLLRTDEELMRLLFDMLPFQRMGSRIEDRLRSVATSMRRH